MVISVIRYLFQGGILLVSALPVIAPKRYSYITKRTAKFVLFATSIVLILSIANDISSAARTADLQEKVAQAERMGVVLTQQLAAAEKGPSLLPLPTRLRGLLEEIDSKIVPALRAGQTTFSGGITASQFTRLQTIAHERGGDEFIGIDPASVRMGIGMGPEGVTYNVTFRVTPKLLQQ